jgi:hypothetical protein
MAVFEVVFFVNFKHQMRTDLHFTMMWLAISLHFNGLKVVLEPITNTKSSKKSCFDFSFRSFACLRTTPEC